MRLALDPQFLRRFMGLIIASLAIYVLFLAFLVLIQRNLMYFPDPTPFKPESYGFQEFTRFDYAADDGIKLHGFYAPPKEGKRLTIVFFQGNAGNLGLRAEKIAMWRDWGYGVMLTTYRGYHGNAGEPDEQGLYMDARASIAALKRDFGVKPEHMVLYGESLGSGVATQMAMEISEAGLVLEVPYTSIPDIGSARYPFVPIFWLALDRYESIRKIRHVHAPLLILKAGRDEVIPSILAQRLYDEAQDPKTLVVSERARHMGIYSTAPVVEKIHGWLNARNAEQPRTQVTKH